MRYKYTMPDFTDFKVGDTISFPCSVEVDINTLKEDWKIKKGKSYFIAFGYDLEDKSSSAFSVTVNSEETGGKLYTSIKIIYYDKPDMNKEIFRIGEENGETKIFVDWTPQSIEEGGEMYCRQAFSIDPEDKHILKCIKFKIYTEIED